MRRQYHTRQVGKDRYVWDVHRLIRLTASIELRLVSISAIRELDENWWYPGEAAIPTPRSLAEHMALVLTTDLKHPIILCSEGRLMDGMHRAVKALLENRETLLAVRFEKTPAPHHINPPPEALSYEDEDL